MNTLPPRYAYAGRVLLVILLFNWSGLPAYICNAQNATESPSGAPSPVRQQQAMAPESDKKPVAEPKPEELPKIADDMEKSFKALEAAEKEIPRDTFDPQAIVNKVGKDPNKLFEWVRDNTYWVPYRGMLRGPIGVLMDRVGSSLDRSLLLAELLRIAGHEVQLAHVELTEEQAKQLLAKVRPVPQNPLPPPPSADRKKMEEQIETYASKYQLDAAMLRTNMEQAFVQAIKLSESVAQRVTKQTPIIAKAVGTPAAEQAEASRAKELSDRLKSLADHWWVQHQEEKSWVNLDPIVPDGKPGQTITVTKPEISSSDKEGHFALDSKDCHEIEIRIVIEQWRNHGTSEHTVLSRMLRPADLIGQQITVMHIPLNWPKDLVLLHGKDALKKLKTFVMAETEWLPVLTLGSKAVWQSGFTDSGDTYDGAAKQLAKNWGFDKPSAAIGGILGSGKIGGRGATRSYEKKLTEGARLTAEWIEYEIRSPGQPRCKIRRQVFDLGRPSAPLAENTAEPAMSDGRRLERGLTLMTSAEILPLVCQLTPDYVCHLAATKMLANRSVLPGVLGQLASHDEKRLAEGIHKITPLPGRLYDLALVRQACSRFRSDVYLDRPNILSYHPKVNEVETGDLLFHQGFDIVANHVAVHSRAMATPFQVSLEQGVLDTNAEALLITGVGKVENSADILAETQDRGFEWVTIRHASDAASHALELPKDVSARIVQDLAAGFVVMVPRKPVSFHGRPVIVWWRVNPQTGETLGIGPDGWGQATTEEMLAQWLGGSIFSTLLCMVGVASTFDFRSGSEDEVNNEIFKDVMACVVLGVAGSTGLYASLTGTQLIVRLLGMGVLSFSAGARGARFLR